MKVARDFTCPTCLARPGHPCNALRPGRNGVASHKARVALAAAANRGHIR